MFSLAAFGGYQSLPLPAPQNLIPQAFFRVDVAYRVQRAFYALTSIRARIAVAQSALDSARAVEGSA